jgi:cytochrome P450
MTRHHSDNLVLNLGISKMLLVGGRDLSRRILEPPPSTTGYSTGKLKRKGMAALAPHALTVSDDEQWVRLRAFNEAVLQAGQRHDLRSVFLAHVRRAFAMPPATIDDIRAAMRRAMLPIVFGPGAPAQLATDVQALFELVQNPVKRMVLAPWGARRRARLYGTLRRVWRDTAASSPPSLLGLAHQAAGELPEAVLLEQIPHWMFTFTGSGTDLLVRALALVTSHPAVLETARREIAAAGPLDQAEAIDSLTFLGSCLMEAARLYPPVTRTFHCAKSGAVAGTVRVPAGTEILHSFPLLGDPALSSPEARTFTPERWISGAAASPTAEFDPFLAGARHCPGRELILFVCTSALAVLLGTQRLIADPPLAPAALPLQFPRRGIRFRT